MSFRNDYTPIWVANTPSDTAFVDYYGLMVTVAGDVVAQPVAGTSLTFPTVPAYTIIPGRFVRVMATGTTATVVGGTA